MKTYILPLSDPKADLLMVGGKGMSLAKLEMAGFTVPTGFHITTEAYRQFVDENDLQSGINEALKLVDLDRPSTLENASQNIRRLFAEAVIPGELANAIVSAYGTLPGIDPQVAVRSSATAEDLPEASFAGQQDTFLNISGEEHVLEATRKCWASLWTARAIGYRSRQNIPPDGVALAVVVQLLVNAEAAGILFTVNPLTGSRDEIVINAAWGLGEAVVSGAVTPDVLTVTKSDGKIFKRQTSEKLVMTVLSDTGTYEEPVPEALRSIPVLSDEKAAELAKIGLQIEDLYGMPMDIEWTLADGALSILQARPVTTLADEPLEWKPPTPKGVYMRTSVVDLMPDPTSPLFATLGLPALVDQMIPLGKSLMRSTPVLPDDYFTTINGYAYMNVHFSARGWLWVLFGMLPAYPRMLRILVPFWREEARPAYQKVVMDMQKKDIEHMSSELLWRDAKVVVEAASFYTSSLMFATMGISAGSEGLLTQVYKKMVHREGDPPATVLLMGWDNIPSRADKSLYDLAIYCQEHETLSTYVLETHSSKIVTRLKSRHDPERVDPDSWHEFCERFDLHLQLFGHMVFELDFAKPLPRDCPEPMVEAIKMFLRGEGANPYERQRENEQKRIETVENVMQRLKGFRRWAFSKVLNLAQSLSEVREDALAEIGIGYPVLRKILRLLGEHLTKAEILQEADDIFWLEKAEIEQILADLDRGVDKNSMDGVVNRRKEFWQKAKRSTPPPMLPMKKKYMGINTNVWLAEVEANQAADTLKGVPASPGQVTAPACVLQGPEDFDQMRPGDVLVAGTTTPAWTPLFSMASAVVTDIGGPLSHGSIVAREYGIPAVMGTGNATRRIQDGQTITVDGSVGVVTIL